jgi:hypothetical protein
MDFPHLWRWRHWRCFLRLGTWWTFPEAAVQKWRFTIVRPMSIEMSWWISSSWKKRIPKSIKHPVFPIISPDKTSSFPIISPGIFMMILGGFGHSLHPDAPCSTSWTLAFSYGEAISAINGPFDLFITKELHGKPRKKSGLHIVLYIILYIIFLWFLSIFFGVLTLEEAPHAQAPPSHLGISRCWTWRQFFQPYFGVDFDICIYIYIIWYLHVFTCIYYNYIMSMLFVELYCVYIMNSSVSSDPWHRCMVMSLILRVTSGFMRVPLIRWCFAMLDHLPVCCFVAGFTSRY